MSDLSSNYLLACPFCGGTPRMATEYDPDGVKWHYITCLQCGARIRGQWHSPGNDCPLLRAEVRDQWNRRASVEPPGDHDVFPVPLSPKGELRPHVLAEPPVDIRPIETAPKDELALFWIVAKTAEESYTDTSGNPIVALSYTPHWELTKLGRWSSLLKATHWSPLPGAPSTKSEEPEPEHVCDGGWACHFHDVKKAADETSERCDRPPPHNPGIPPTPRCRLLKGHEGPCDYPF